jgi:putative CocE/NonD family hydrolase
MTVASRIAARLMGIPAADETPLRVERDLRAVMADGTVLLADRWYPDRGDQPAEHPPVILLRSPYGRRKMRIFGHLFAERGYQVVVQSCRGTFGSGGTWDAFRSEQADGVATVAWIQAQPWFGGSLATFGPSYLGLTQWAIAAAAPEALGAMALDVTTANFRDAVVYPGETFALETGASWLHLLAHQERPWLGRLKAQLGARRAQKRATSTLPLAEADHALIGARVPSYQDWLVHEIPGDPWWDAVDFRPAIPTLPPSSLVGGWYDIFLRQQVDDYQALVAAGRDTRLVIGPWTHASLRGLATGFDDGLDLFDSRLRGKAPRHRAPVRVFVMGSDRWVELDAWPPPAHLERWHLHQDGGLGPERSDASPPDRYRYDPAHPTPSCGGPSLAWPAAGRKDQRRREERADVLSYTSEPLRTDVTVAGPLVAQVWVRSSTPDVDVFTRLCDVAADGESLNISDGIRRLGRHTPVEADGTRSVEVRMWPTATTFRRGHRIRLQVSSAAHPLFARNPGTGDPLGTARRLQAVEVEILHDPDHPSAVMLPVSSI